MKIKSGESKRKSARPIRKPSSPASSAGTYRTLYLAWACGFHVKRCSLHRVSISNARMLFPHKPLTAVSNFDQTCEQYGTDAQFAPEYM